MRCSKSTLRYWTHSYGAFQQGLVQTTGKTRRGLMPGCPDYKQKFASVCVVPRGNTHRVLAHIFRDKCVYQNPLRYVCGKPLTRRWNYSTHLKSFLCQSGRFSFTFTPFSPMWSKITRVCAVYRSSRGMRLSLGRRSCTVPGWGAEGEKRPRLRAERLGSCSGTAPARRAGGDGEGGFSRGRVLQPWKLPKSSQMKSEEGRQTCSSVTWWAQDVCLFVFFPYCLAYSLWGFSGF